MNHTSVDFELVIDTFLLLLIGIGPKITLVPFLGVTAAIDTAARAQVVRKCSPPQETKAIKGRDPLRIAVFALAVPYLLNPAGS